MGRDKPFIGQMDRLIKIVSFGSVRNETNEKRTIHLPVCSPYAMMEDLSATEEVEGKVRAVIIKKYTIRYNASVSLFKNKLAIIDQGVTYNVTGVLEIGRKYRLQLTVKKYE